LSRASGEISDDLVGFARLLCVTQDDFERAKKKEALPNARLDAYAAATVTSASQIIRDALADYLPA